MKFSKIKDGFDFDDRLTFGKYCGVLVEDVIDSDASYILWLVANTNHSFTKKVLVDAIKEDFLQKQEARAKSAKNWYEGKATRPNPYDGLGFKNSAQSLHSDDLDNLFDDVPF